MSSKNNNRVNNLKSIPKKIDTTYLTANTLIVVLIFVAVIGFAVYFWQQYKKMEKAAIEKQQREGNPNHCPDYWEIEEQIVDDTGKLKGVKCKNVQHLGKCAINPGDDMFTFDDEIFTNPSTRDISRCKWAKQCQVAWTGYDGKC
jgi:hypothetical protein